jgi:CRP-like cAMP-binding protein
MSYEQDIKERLDRKEPLPEKLDISLVKYFWQANPLIGVKSDTLPRFLRKVKVLKNFSDNELRLLSKSMHLRSFGNGEKIFNQNDLGVGFFLIYTGNVDIIVEKDSTSELSNANLDEAAHIVSLERSDYFGELALLQEHSYRNASAIARNNCQILGIFKPDIENLIGTNPIVATKLLQSVSSIIANRLFSLTTEVRSLKYKIKQLEKGQNESAESKAE